MSERWPEHEKLAKVSDESQSLGLFLDWVLRVGGFALCDPDGHAHDKGCYVDSGRRVCGMRSGELTRTSATIEEILGLYFGIDPKKLQDEKQAMFEELRAVRP